MGRVPNVSNVSSSAGSALCSTAEPLLRTIFTGSGFSNDLLGLMVNCWKVLCECLWKLVVDKVCVVTEQKGC